MQVKSKKRQSVNVLLMFTVLALLFILFLPSAAHAAAGSGAGLPYEGWIGKIVDSVSGPLAYGISVIALVASGAALIFGGDMNGFLKALIFLVLVLSLIVAGKNTLSAITGVGATVAEGPAVHHVLPRVGA